MPTADEKAKYARFKKLQNQGHSLSEAGEEFMKEYERQIKAQNRAERGRELNAEALAKRRTKLAERKALEELAERKALEAAGLAGGPNRSTSRGRRASPGPSPLGPGRQSRMSLASATRRRRNDENLRRQATRARASRESVAAANALKAAGKEKKVNATLVARFHNGKSPRDLMLMKIKEFLAFIRESSSAEIDDIRKVFGRTKVHDTTFKLLQVYRTRDSKKYEEILSHLTPAYRHSYDMLEAKYDLLPEKAS